MRAMRDLRSSVRAPRLAAALGAILVASVPAAAQVPTLERVDTLVAAGDYEGARTDLERWWSARDQFVVPGSDMARALMLRAQLAPDPAAAEPDYLAVVLGYPASNQAPEALLRLGQGLLATGEAARSAAYLGRLVADYPGRPQRLTGLLWLARANAAARRPGPACTAARQGLEDARDPDLAAMLRAEVESSCAGLAATGVPASATGDPAPAGSPVAGAGVVQPSVSAPQRAAPAGSAGSRAADSRNEARTGDWAVQSGAFRYTEGAERLVERLREAGYSPRLVRVPRNDLLRVRLGRFTSRDQANALAARLRAGGFDAVAVSDAGQERSP